MCQFNIGHPCFSLQKTRLKSVLLLLSIKTKFKNKHIGDVLMMIACPLFPRPGVDCISRNRSRVLARDTEFFPPGIPPPVIFDT